MVFLQFSFFLGESVRPAKAVLASFLARNKHSFFYSTTVSWTWLSCCYVFNRLRFVYEKKILSFFNYRLLNIAVFHSMYGKFIDFFLWLAVGSVCAVATHMTIHHAIDINSQITTETCGFQVD